MKANSVEKSAPPAGGFVVDDRFGRGTDIARLSPDGLRVGTRKYGRVRTQVPADIPDHWRGLIGEYGWDHNTLYIHERDGKLHALNRMVLRRSAHRIGG